MEKDLAWDIEHVTQNPLEVRDVVGYENGLVVLSGFEQDDELDEEFELEDESGLGEDSAADALQAQGTVDESLGLEEVISRAIERAALGDQGAPFEPEALLALSNLRDNNFAAWIRKRGELKAANKAVPLTKLDKAIKDFKRNNKPVKPTHHSYAVAVLKRLSIGSHKPVAVMGTLYIPRSNSRLWEELETGRLRRKIAELHDDNENCFRHEDYEAIGKHVLDLAADPDFFVEAPNGIACLRSFYSVKSGKIHKEPLGLHHRQVRSLAFEPADMPTPAYDAFMNETFRSEVEGEEEAQTRLVEEFAGAAMLGIAPLHQKVMLWYDRYGRAGKGTLQQIYEQLVPEGLRASLPPFKWNQEYYVAALAGKRLNVVGELPDDKLIPAADFKTVIGRDQLTGRSPAGKPFTLRNEAAHLFTSNHFVQTSDHTEAFYSRWILVEFPNSRIKSGLPLDPLLAQRIVRTEMPGIAYKALQAAARVVEQDGYSASLVHDRLMAQWRRSSSSVEEFMYDECELGQTYHILRSTFYELYRSWCIENGRKPLSKAKVKNLLESNLSVGTWLAKLDGYEIFRGVRKKVEPKPTCSVGPVEVAAVVPIQARPGAQGQDQSGYDDPDF